MSVNQDFRIIDARYPSYYKDSTYWSKWREVYNGGEDYTYQYLKKFTSREPDAEFVNRRSITPTPTYAKAAVNDVRNSIFQRMVDIIRRDGSQNYMRAVSGDIGGVDRRGSTMNGFIGIDVLTELLIMGKVGVYVDMPRLAGPTLADVGGARPYIYLYRVEDILSWSYSMPDEPQEITSLLLRDRCVEEQVEFMPGVHIAKGTYERYRLLWIDPNTGLVNLQFFDKSAMPISLDGVQLGKPQPITLELRRIPFVLFDIGDSLLKDVSQHQAALLNLGSSDIAYALKANFPFYVEQQDNRAIGDHLKHQMDPSGTATVGGQGASDREITVGATHGRIYSLGAEKPDFIHPSPEPLQASMALQEKLEDDIRKLVNLEVSNKVGKRTTSAEALKLSDQGLEAGLSYIGLVLENGERKIATYWSYYEDRNPKNRRVAIIKYPDRYSLKTDLDRIQEANKLSELVYTVPGKTAKKELQKSIVYSLLEGKISNEKMEQIEREIESAEYATSNPDIIISASEAGLCGDKVASMALGFNEDEYLQAREDHADRAARIVQAQSSAKMGSSEETQNPGARGVSDLSDDPANEGREERKAATDTTLKMSTKKPVRGKGRDTKDEDD